jgi:hypothetical protein
VCSRTPGSISLRYASSSVPPLIPETCVVTTTLSGPGSGSATADLTRTCELDIGGDRRHHLLIMAAGEQAKGHVARVLHAH